MLRVASLLGLASLAVFLSGCAFGLGEAGGGGDALPPMVPQASEATRDRAEVSGRVLFSKALRERLSKEPSRVSTGANRPDGVLSWEGSFLGGLTASLEGGSRALTTAVAFDGSFAFRGEREGLCQARISSGRSLIASVTLPVDKRSRTLLSVEILGRDYPDLDRNGDRRDWLTRVTAACRAPGIEYSRAYEPGGRVVTSYPEGTLEYGAPGGEVRVIAADGTRQSRPALLGGRQLARPLMLQARVEPLLDPAARGAGILRWSASVDLEGEARSVRVRAQLYSETGREGELELLDDGSKVDLDAALEGHQGSGDDRAGDGVFTLLTPVDRSNLVLLYSGVAVLGALGESGVSGSRVVLFLEGEARERAAGREGGLARKLGTVDLVSRGAGLGAEFTFTSRPVQPLSGGLFGPGSAEAALVPDPDPLRYSSSVLPAKLPGYYFVALASGEGVYHAGTVLEDGKPRDVALAGRRVRRSLKTEER